jgi:hypothetical protein
VPRQQIGASLSRVVLPANDARKTMTRRFESLLDPCGNWMIWDRSVDLPATYQGQVLEGLEADDARKLTSLLNVMNDIEPAGTADERLRVGKKNGAV